MMFRTLFIPAVAAVALACSVAHVNPAHAGGCLSGAKHKVCCPKCESSCCTLEAKVVDEEKKCFEVECETICIPRVVFPWQVKKLAAGGCDSCSGRGCTNCVHNGARIRKVKKLKSKKYTCPKCEYKWTPKEGASCCGGGCADGCCDKGACDVAPVYDHYTATPPSGVNELPHYDAAKDAMKHQSEAVVPDAPQPGQGFAPVNVQVP